MTPRLFLYNLQTLCLLAPTLTSSHFSRYFSVLVAIFFSCLLCVCFPGHGLSLSTTNHCTWTEAFILRFQLHSCAADPQIHIFSENLSPEPHLDVWWALPIQHVQGCPNPPSSITFVRSSLRCCHDGCARNSPCHPRHPNISLLHNCSFGRNFTGHKFCLPESISIAWSCAQTQMPHRDEIILYHLVTFYEWFMHGRLKFFLKKLCVIIKGKGTQQWWY